MPLGAPAWAPARPRRRHLAALVVGLGAIAAAPLAHAQIVNVHPLVDGSNEPGFSAALEASMDLRTGNTRLMAVRGAAMARWQCGDHLVFALLKAEHGESGSPLTRFVSKSFEHLRYRYRATSLVATEVFAQNEADQLRRLRLRALLGAGPRFRLFDADRGSLHLGVAAMLEHERLSRDDVAGAGASQTAARMSSYVVGQVRLNDRATTTASAYLQPRVDALRDVRSLAEGALLVEVAKRVTFKVALALAHDSRPPPETSSTDVALNNAVSIAF
jgi:hypothetical protein